MKTLVADDGLGPSLRPLPLTGVLPSSFTAFSACGHSLGSPTSITMNIPVSTSNSLWQWRSHGPERNILIVQSYVSMIACSRQLYFLVYNLLLVTFS